MKRLLHHAHAGYQKAKKKMQERDYVLLQTIHGIELSLVLIVGIIIATGTYAFTSVDFSAYDNGGGGPIKSTSESSLDGGGGPIK